MISSISASNSPQANAEVQPTATSAKASVATVGPGEVRTPQQADTVKLSLSAQIHALYHQGMRLSQIASNLGISAKTVSGYLPGSVPNPPAPTSAAAPTSAPTPAPTPVPAATPAPAAAQGASAAALTAKD